jgi:hypothetical protein
MTTILGLDVASNMGVCDWTIGYSPIFSTERLGAEDEEGFDAWRRKAARATRFIARRLGDQSLRPVREIVIEAPVEGGLQGRTNANTTSLKFILLGALLGPMGLKDVRVVGARISTVRKHFIGHGNLKGDEAKRLVRKVCREIGWDCNNYDESDAGAVAHWRATQLGLLVPDVKPFHYRKIAA